MLASLVLKHHATGNVSRAGHGIQIAHHNPNANRANKTEVTVPGHAHGVHRKVPTAQPAAIAAPTRSRIAVVLEVAFVAGLVSALVTMFVVGAICGILQLRQAVQPPTKLGGEWEA